MYLINPLTQRVGYRIGWQDNWFAHKKHYVMVLHTMFNIRSIIYFVFRKRRFEEGGLYISDFSLILSQNKMLVRISFYDIFMFKFYIIKRVMRKLSRWMYRAPSDLARKVWFQSKWIKDQLLPDLNPYAYKFIIICRILGIDVESFLLDNVFRLYPKREARKIARLRVKYSKGHIWLAEEEFNIIKKVLNALSIGGANDWIGHKESVMFKKLRLLGGYMTYFVNNKKIYELKEFPVRPWYLQVMKTDDEKKIYKDRLRRNKVLHMSRKERIKIMQKAYLQYFDNSFKKFFSSRKRFRNFNKRIKKLYKLYKKNGIFGKKKKIKVIKKEDKEALADRLVSILRGSRDDSLTNKKSGTVRFFKNEQNIKLNKSKKIQKRVKKLKTWFSVMRRLRVLTMHRNARLKAKKKARQLTKKRLKTRTDMRAYRRLKRARWIRKRKNRRKRAEARVNTLFVVNGRVHNLIDIATTKLKDVLRGVAKNKKFMLWLRLRRKFKRLRRVYLKRRYGRIYRLDKRYGKRRLSKQFLAFAKVSVVRKFFFKPHSARKSVRWRNLRFVRTLKGIGNSLYTHYLVKYSYIRIFYIIWLMRLFSDQVEDGTKNYFNRVTLSELAFMLFSTFIRYPFFKVYGSFLEYYIYKFFKMSSNFNFYIVSNDELSADFIARHIGLCFWLGYKWKEVVVPIKKDLRLRTRFRYHSWKWTRWDIKRLSEPKDWFESIGYLDFKFWLRYEEMFYSCVKKQLATMLDDVKHPYFCKKYKILKSIIPHITEIMMFSQLLVVYHERPIFFFSNKYKLRKVAKYPLIPRKTRSFKFIKRQLNAFVVSLKRYKPGIQINDIRRKYGFINKIPLGNFNTHLHAIIGSLPLQRHQLYKRFMDIDEFFRIYRKKVTILKNEPTGLVINYGKIYLKDYSVMTNRILRLARYQKYNQVYGFKLRFSGRHKRRSRRAHVWYKRGQLGLSKMSEVVDYGQFFVALQYSTISVRVWMYINSLQNKYRMKLS